MWKSSALWGTIYPRQNTTLHWWLHVSSGPSGKVFLHSGWYQPNTRQSLDWNRAIKRHMTLANPAKSSQTNQSLCVRRGWTNLSEIPNPLSTKYGTVCCGFIWKDNMKVGKIRPWRTKSLKFSWLFAHCTIYISYLYVFRFQLFSFWY